MLIKRCDCHIQSQGHWFGPDLKCEGCGTTWAKHQKRDRKCAKRRSKDSNGNYKNKLVLNREETIRLLELKVQGKSFYSISVEMKIGRRVLERVYYRTIRENGDG